MKYTNLAALAVVFLAATSTASAQTPPEGWTALALQNVLDIPTNLNVQYEETRCAGENESECFQLWRRGMRGQLDRLDRNRRRHQWYSDRGGRAYRRNGNIFYDSYGRWHRGRRGRDADTWLLAGGVVLQGVDMILEHRRENAARRERAADRAEERDWRDEQRQARDELEQENRELRERLEAIEQSSAPIRTTTRQYTVVNRTGCVVTVKTAGDNKTTLRQGEWFRTTFDPHRLQARVENGHCSTLKSAMTKNGKRVELTCEGR
jgi:hypothetical protein